MPFKKKFAGLKNFVYFVTFVTIVIKLNLAFQIKYSLYILKRHNNSNLNFPN